MESVFGLDNSLSNPVRRLRYIAWVAPEGRRDGQEAYYAEYSAVNWLQLRFNAAGNDSVENLSLSIRSENFVWLKEAEMALNEQLERTIPSNTMYRLKAWYSKYIAPLAFALGPVLVLFITVGCISILVGKKVLPIGIPLEMIDEFRAMAGVAQTDTEKLNFIYQFLSSSIPQEKASSSSAHIFRSVSFYKVFLPLVVIGAALYFLIKCYPMRVFVWGDYASHYQTLVERRKTLIQGVILAMVVGLLTQYFGEGMSAFR